MEKRIRFWFLDTPVSFGFMEKFEGIIREGDFVCDVRKDEIGQYAKVYRMGIPFFEISLIK